MAAIILPRRFKSQPQSRASVDHARGIIKAFTPANGNATPQGGITPVIRADGVGFRATSQTAYYRASSAKILAGLPQWCVIAAFSTTQTTIPQGRPFYCERAPSGNDILKVECLSNDLQALLTLRDDAGALIQIKSSTSVADGRLHVVTAVRYAANDHRLFVDGKQENASVTSLTNYTDAIESRIGSDVADFNAVFNDPIYFIGLFNRALSPAEIADIGINPWKLLKAPPRKLWAAASAGGTTHDLIGVGQISSAEAFGTPALSAGIASSGVASNEALGSAGVTAGISTVGIATAEGIGSTALAAEVSAAGGIETAEAGGSPALAADIVGSAIASTESLGSGTLAVAVQAGGITSTEAIGSPEVGGVAPANVIGAGAIASAETVGGSAISATVDVVGIGTDEALGQPAVGAPAAAIDGVGQIASGEAAGSPVVGGTIAAAGVDSTEAFGSAAVSVHIAGVGNIVSAEAFGAPNVGEMPDQEIVGAGGIASTEAFGSANVHPFVPYTGTGFQPGSGYRPIRRQHRQAVPAIVPHSIGTVGIESAERFGYPALTWRGRTRRIREEEFLLGRAA